MSLARRRLLPLSLSLLLFASCTNKHPDGRALTPRQSLKSMRLSDDFHVELFAGEPDVVDPVEMVFDETGKVYVAEMIDYPEDPPPGKTARSRIRLLEDTNSDGKIDRSTIFAREVLEVSSIFPWRGGLIVTSAPDILYLKDTNGDGKADVRRVLDRYPYTDRHVLLTYGSVDAQAFGVETENESLDGGSEESEEA